ncbi:hypothetical protein GCM10023317_27800 [Actinopolymorpha pittospori]
MDRLCAREFAGVTALGIAALERVEVEPAVPPKDDLRVDDRPGRQVGVQRADQLGKASPSGVPRRE